MRARGKVGKTWEVEVTESEVEKTISEINSTTSAGVSGRLKDAVFGGVLRGFPSEETAKQAFCQLHS